MITIRPAALADLPRILEMGTRFLHSTQYACEIGDNPAQMRILAERLLTQSDGMIVVADREGHVVGMIGMLLFPHHISSELIAGEVFWWMEPEARGGGLRLLRAAETWARAQGVKRIQMIAPTLAVGHVYQRCGYQLVEMAYQRTLA